MTPLASITPEPLFQELGTGHTVVLRNEVTVIDPARDRTWRIPAGYTFDGPSVPRLCAPAIAKEDLGNVAALPHDWLYGAGGVASRGPLGVERYTRAEADALFADLLAWRGADPVKREAAFLAVREFGASHWRAA